MIKQVDYYMCPKCDWTDCDNKGNKDMSHYCSRCGGVTEYWYSEDFDVEIENVLETSKENTIVEKKTYSCPNCYEKHTYLSNRVNRNNYCHRCNVKLEYESTFLFDIDKNEIVKYLDKVEPKVSIGKVDINYVRLWYMCPDEGCCHMEAFVEGNVISTICPKCGKQMVMIKREHRSTKGDRAQEIEKQQKLNEYLSHPNVRCPYCGSSNTAKIADWYKAASVGMFGVYGLPAASKQWTCKDCKSDF